jgi:hypothetical protein
LNEKIRFILKNLLICNQNKKNILRKKLVSDKTQIASYKVAELITQKQNHTRFKLLILPLCSEIEK